MFAKGFNDGRCGGECERAVASGVVGCIGECEDLSFGKRAGTFALDATGEFCVKDLWCDGGKGKRA